MMRQSQLPFQNNLVPTPAGKVPIKFLTAWFAVVDPCSLNHLETMYRKAKSLLDAGHLSGDELIVIDKDLKSFFDIMGACERIKNTPIPFSYSIFLKKFIFFYILTLPIGFVAYFEYWAIPISVFVFYVLVSLEIIAEEIEMPFGRDANDLPTQYLSDMIRGDVNEIFTE